MDAGPNTASDRHAEPREYVVSARDRCDETVDRIRSVRMGDYKYIRNSYPQRPYLQPCRYKDAKPFMPVLRELYASGQTECRPVTTTRGISTRRRTLRPRERDPWELNNLAGETRMLKRTLKQMRGVLDRWILESDDKGRLPESDAMYDSDMEPYLQKSKASLAPVASAFWNPTSS